MTPPVSADVMQDVWQYPLFDALYGRRSRRFGVGFEMTEGRLSYRSRQPAVALGELEEALLVAAGVGQTGTPLWDHPRSNGERPGAPSPRPRGGGELRSSSRTTRASS